MGKGLSPENPLISWLRHLDSNQGPADKQSASDEPLVELAATTQAGLWHLSDALGPHAATGPEYKRLADLPLRTLAALGMSPASRANLAAAPRERKAGGFADLRDMDDSL